MESFSDFKKLYGRIEGTLKANKTYTIGIYDSYDSAKLGTNKYVFLTEIGLFGGRNYVLAGIFLGAAAMIFLTILFFFCCYFAKLHKKNRDTEDFINNLTY